MKKFDIPHNTMLIRILHYSLELNAFINILRCTKQFYKNKIFENLAHLKAYLNEFYKKS